jgi:hypothetical protein
MSKTNGRRPPATNGNAVRARRWLQRRRQEAEMGDELAIRSMAVPRQRAITYLEKRGDHREQRRGAIHRLGGCVRVRASLLT